MPKTTAKGQPRKSELPDTLRRSSAKAQRTWAKTHDEAAEQYGDGERAHRTAYSALKHSFEKVGDHWEPKQRRGPSDPQAKQGPPRSRTRPRDTAGGVDVEGNTKEELMERARRLDVRGRSKMSKLELGQAIARKQG
ncbi:MAG TPA: ChaB family protein [Solirubrobacteraceae bacterium]|nr:ChaB family protein [Solirubrobacteraceae bacterium]